MSKCDNCKRFHKSCSGGEEMADYCDKRNLRLPITNKDKLMSGSEEELAWFILHKIHTASGATCPPPLVKERCPVDIAKGLTCEECWARWLKQEAEAC